MKEEVFSTKTAKISLCGRSDSFVLTMEKDEISFRMCDLYAFKKKILSFSVIDLLEPDAPDVEVIRLPHCDRFLVLNILQILEFRELLNGAFNTLALNSAIKQILR